MQIDPKLTITRDAAQKLVPTLVAYVESKFDSALWEKLDKAQKGLRKGQPVIVAIRDPKDRQKATYVQAKISLVNHLDISAVDGPLVRVQAGNVSWRVDGNDPFHPVQGGN